MNPMLAETLALGDLQGPLDAANDPGMVDAVRERILGVV